MLRWSWTITLPIFYIYTCPTFILAQREQYQNNLTSPKHQNTKKFENVPKPVTNSVQPLLNEMCTGISMEMEHRDLSITNIFLYGLVCSPETFLSNVFSTHGSFSFYQAHLPGLTTVAPELQYDFESDVTDNQLSTDGKLRRSTHTLGLYPSPPIGLYPPPLFFPSRNKGEGYQTFTKSDFCTNC